MSETQSPLKTTVWKARKSKKTTLGMEVGREQLSRVVLIVLAPDLTPDKLFKEVARCFINF